MTLLYRLEKCPSSGSTLGLFLQVGLTLLRTRYPMSSSHASQDNAARCYQRVGVRSRDMIGLMRATALSGALLMTPLQLLQPQFGSMAAGTRLHACL